MHSRNSNGQIGPAHADVGTCRLAYGPATAGGHLLFPSNATSFLQRSPKIPQRETHCGEIRVRLQPGRWWYGSSCSRFQPCDDVCWGAVLATSLLLCCAITGEPTWLPWDPHFGGPWSVQDGCYYSRSVHGVFSQGDFVLVLTHLK